MIVLMAGLPGSGKSTLARELARLTSGARLDKDEIRAALFAPQDIEYSARQDDLVVEMMLEAARFLTAKNPSRKIFLDGRTFSRRYQIDRVAAFAGQCRQPWVILECRCSDASARQRLEVEPDPSHPAANRNFALYLEMKASFEPIVHPKVTVQTDAPLAHCVELALAALHRAAALGARP